MAYESKGTIKEIKDVQVITDKFRKQELVLTIPNGKYPDDVIFQATNDRIDTIMDLKVGQEIRIDWNLNGKGFTKNGDTRYFNSLNIWKVEVLSQPQQQANNAMPASKNFVMDDAENDLPF